MSADRERLPPQPEPAGGYSTGLRPPAGTAAPGMTRSAPSLDPAHGHQRDVLIARPELREKIVEIPHVQYIEHIQEIPQTRKISKFVAQPNVDVRERVIEIPKNIKEQKIVEVPQIQVVDHVVEVPQYITQQKIVEVPRIMLQERIIPIPKRIIEEKIVEIPQEDFDQVLKERVDYASESYGPARLLGAAQVDDGRYGRSDEPMFDANGNPVLDEYGKQVFYQKQPPYMGDVSPTRPVDEVVEIPHVQHVYRNIMQSVYRHVPKPVEVPLTHYKPIPIERVVDRNVPIPVELEVIQEFLCPRLEAKYSEVTVPIPVTRVIERPVPADAMFNSVIMEAYMRGHAPTVSPCYQSCTPGWTGPTEQVKMTVPELHAAGISGQPSFSHVKSFKSRAGSFGGVNISQSRDWLSTQRTLIKEGGKDKHF